MSQFMQSLHFSLEKDTLFSQAGELDSITISPNSKRAGWGYSSVEFGTLDTDSSTQSKKAAVY